MSWPVLPLGLLGSQASASAAPADNDTYQVSRSLRFNSLDSAYLNRTFPTAGNRKTWTWSGWVKRSSSAYQQIFGSYIGSGTTDTNYFEISFFNDNINVTGYSTTYLRSTAVYRDFSAWYHIVVTTDTTTATADNRIKIYVNGAEITSFSTRNNPTPQSVDLGINAAYGHYLGGVQGNAYYLSAYLTEINFIDGQALTPSSFGETDATTGRWKAKAFTGTYGTNGFYLPFLDNSGATATTLGKDTSTYRMLTAQLNGTSNGIQRGADLTGIANGKAGTISLWVNFTNSAGSYNPLWVSRNNSTIGDSVQLSRQAGGGLRLAALNSAGTGILNVSTAGAACSSSGLYHIYATWDLSVNNRVFIYVNGIDSTGTISTFTNDTIQYSVPNHGLGGNLFSSFVPVTPAMLGQVYVNYSTYLDPVTNISKFYSGSSTPVSLGTSGEIPSGSSPIVYLDGDATTILTNRGTGGNFAAHGTLATGTTYQGVGVHYNNWTPNNLSVTPGTGNDSLVDSPTNFGAISTTLVPDTYQIGKSLRFNSADSAYLARTTSASFTSQRIFTFSFWCKRSTLSSAQSIFDRNQASNTNQFAVGFNANDTFAIAARTSGTTTVSLNLTTSAVFKDTSAWYHFMISVDNTQAVLGDRGKIYVNGVLQSLGTQTATQNVDYHLLTGLTYDIGRTAITNSQYFDGYLTEVHFVDGQALTPSSFGTRDINTYLWKPKAYTGTYGVNGFYLPFSNTSTGSNSVLTSEDFSAAMYTKDASSVTTNTTTAPNGATTADTFTENSATTFHRFYFNNLTYTNGVTFTSSVYVKANTRSAVALENWNGAAANYCYADLSNGTVISGSHVSAAISSVGNGWYRISVSNVGTAGGVACGSALYIMNNAIAGSLSYTGNGSGSVFVWGMQTEASSVAGPYLWTNGFANSPTLLIGADASVATGGYNTWYPNNLSVTPGTGNDSLVDSPTYYGTDTGVGGEARGDYCTLNPLNNSGVLSNGNLVFQASTTATQVALGTSKIIPSGKTYFEVNVVTAAGSGTFFQVGIAPGGKSLASAIGTVSGNGYAIEQEQANDIQLRLNGSTVVISTVMQTGDVLQVAVDHATGKLWFGRNNTWYDSSGGTTGNPSAGTNQSATISTVIDWFPAVAKYSTGGSYAINFGQRPFAYAAPSGFKALRDYNKLPVPTGGEVRGNYATNNPIDNSGGATLSNGNLDVSISGLRSTRSSIAMTRGKWYCEVLVNTVGNTMVGVLNSSALLSQHIGSNANSWGYYHNGNKYTNNVATAFGNTYTNADIIGIAYDADAGKVWFSKNGAWQASGDPAAGTNEAYSSITGSEIFFGGSNSGSASSCSISCNFGQRPWAYDAPFGFLPLCTTLLPQPIIQKSSTAMDVVTYTGDSTSSRTISGLNFNPDLIWIKNRTNAYNNTLVDVIRGGSLYLESNNTNADQSATVVSSFNSDGFQIGTSSIQINGSSNQYVAWAWDAGSSSVTNTSGSITSTVRANPQAGVSVVSFVNASGTNQSTVGHGLGSSPKMIIAKNRDTSANNWAVFHSSVCDTTSKFLQLNTTSALTTFATVWGASLPSSSVFGVTGGGIATASVNMIAYCFAEVEGFSKFGSYTGNGSADGPFVFCGFRPRWVMYKRTDSTASWLMLDTALNPSNNSSTYLIPNLSSAEGTDNVFDILSNGFKLRNGGATSNASGGTYIFAAFAESPFKYARAR